MIEYFIFEVAGLYAQKLNKEGKMIKEIKRGPIYISHNSLRFITVFSRDVTILDKKTLVITKRAQEFLEGCLKGEETLTTGKLYVGASQDLRDLGWAMPILGEMRQGKSGARLYLALFHFLNCFR